MAEIEQKGKTQQRGITCFLQNAAIQILGSRNKLSQRKTHKKNKSSKFGSPGSEIHPPKKKKIETLAVSNGRARGRTWRTTDRRLHSSRYHRSFLRHFKRIKQVDLVVAFPLRLRPLSLLYSAAPRFFS